MKKIIFTCLLAAGLVSCNIDRIHPSGNIITEERSTGAFSAITVEGGLKVNLKMADSEYVKVSADDNIMHYIQTVVNGNTLVVKKDRRLLILGQPSITIYVEAARLTSAKASGASTITLQNILEAGEFDMNLSGASKIEGDANMTGKLTANISGASSLNLSGMCDELALKASGASRFRSFDFTADNADIDVSGASGVEITVSSLLRVKASGASTVHYKGDPQVDIIENSGASDIRGM